MSNFNQQEVEKFSKLASEWWNTNGKFKTLHQFNTPRVKFIANELQQQQLSPNQHPACLDIGCGGGILTEAIFKAGYHNIDAIDASYDSIQVAIQHAKEHNLNINYYHESFDSWYNKYQKKYDIIFAMEIIEHTNQPMAFLRSIQQMLQPNGVLFISTINRNLKSLVLAKFMAEYILKWLPKNTHQYAKFIKPQELNSMLQQLNINTLNTKGINFNLLRRTWQLSNDYNVNYISASQYQPITVE